MKRNRKNEQEAEPIIPGLEAFVYDATGARNKWDKEVKVHYTFKEQSATEINLPTLPTKEAILKSNLEKVESIFREAREKDLSLALKSVELLHKLSQSIENNGQNEIIIEL